MARTIAQISVQLVMRARSCSSMQSATYMNVAEASRLNAWAAAAGAVLVLGCGMLPSIRTAEVQALVSLGARAKQLRVVSRRRLWPCLRCASCHRRSALGPTQPAGSAQCNAANVDPFYVTSPTHPLPRCRPHHGATRHFNSLANQKLPPLQFCPKNHFTPDPLCNLTTS